MTQMWWRQCRGEWAKLASLRSTWIILPLALVVGLVASLVMCGEAVIAREVLGGAVRSWDVIQVAHWVRMMTCTLFALWAVSSVTGEYRSGTMALSYRACQRPAVMLGAKWFVTGLVAMALTLLTGIAVFIVDKLMFPTVAGHWTVASSDVHHLLWALPVYSFLACGLGVGIGALCRTAAISVAVVLLWQFVLEPFSVVLPHGAQFFAYLPFGNGAVFIGEETQFPLPVAGWLPAGAMFAVWVLGACVAGCYRLHRVHR